MCVTNTTTRRPVSLGAQVAASPSMISQRLCDSLLSLTAAVQASTEPTVAARAEVKPMMAPSSVVHDDEKNRKRRNKRKRKPQKPGKTAKMNDRHFVVHNYHDHARDAPEDVIMMEAVADETTKRRGGVSVAFPLKLHAMLDQIERDGLGHIISWQPHGRCFVIHKPQEFVDRVIKKYFRQTKLTSFQRQLNLYGFQRITKGADNTGYYHELFLRGKTFLCKHMQRIKVKGTGFKAASSPDDEPDFYQMPPVSTVTPNHSSDDAHSDDGSVMSDSTLTHQDQYYAPPTAVVQMQQQHPLERPFFPQISPVASMSNIEPIPFQQACFLPPTPVKTERQAEAQPGQVLDEVVDQLFLQDSSEEENDTILDFVETWDPHATYGDEWYDGPIDDDAELGRLLEQVLDEN